MKKSTKKYVLLEGIENFNRFYSTNSNDDPTKLSDGTVAYRIIGYADTPEEAQTKLYGRVYK